MSEGVRLRHANRGAAVLFVSALLISVLPFQGGRAGAEDGDRMSPKGTIEFPVVNGPGSRGGLVLMDGERAVLTGEHRYSYITLGEGSTLILESCRLNITGDLFNDPIMEGSVSSLIVRNSSVHATGLDAPGLSRSGGQNASVKVSVSCNLEVKSSSIKVSGGAGLYPEQEGCYLTGTVNGTMFKGGNATLNVSIREGASCAISGSTIVVEGGRGGDAPDGEQLGSFATDDMPGGYTLGGDVCGEAGRGGSALLEIQAPRVSIGMEGASFEAIGGKGADAGSGGYIISSVSRAFDDPLPAGGYTAGRWSSGDTVLPGAVSGNVGRGGDSSIFVLSRSLDIAECEFSSLGGDGGDAGRPGEGTYEGVGGWSYVRAGLGGAGYSGGVSTPGGGQDGGRVRDRVGSGGDALLIVDAGSELLTVSNTLSCSGGNGGAPSPGGRSGSVEEGSYQRGGGGGGGGFSGGAGGGLSAIGHSITGGKAGTVDGTVGAGGNTTFVIEADYSSGSGDISMDARKAKATTLYDYNGKDTRSISTGLVIAEGGKGAIGQAVPGSACLNAVYPAPFLSSPVDEGFLRDITEGLSWLPASPSLGTSFYRFRLLRSMDVYDVLHDSGLISEREALLPEDPGDGTYWWSVWVDGSMHDSIWARPHRFMMDRVPPVLEMPGGPSWVNGSSSGLSIDAFDEVSGLDEGSVQYKLQSVGSVSSNWIQAKTVGLGNGRYRVTASTPSEGGEYEVFFRANDKAGNGPVVSGPFVVMVDTAPPTVSSISPAGWSAGHLTLSFDASDQGSGLVEEAWVRAEGGSRQEVVKGRFGLLSDGVRRTCDGALILGTGEWDLTVSVADKVGNHATSQPSRIQVDKGSPLISGPDPVDGAWINTSRPHISFLAADIESGVDRAYIRMEGSSSTYSHPAVEQDHGLWSFVPDTDLKDGMYNWTVSAEDATGNHAEAGPFTFGVDTGPPSVEIKGPYRYIDGGFELTLGASDRMSGFVRVEVENVLWDGKGWVEGNRIGIHDWEVGADGTIRIKAHFEQVPVLFLRVRASDRAGNVCPWTEVRRYDVAYDEPSLTVENQGFIRGGEPLFVHVQNVLGFDMETFRVLSEDSIGSKLVETVDLEVVKEGTIPSTPGLRAPVEVRAMVPTMGMYGECRVRVEFRDAVPLGGLRVLGSAGPVIDSDPPRVDLASPMTVDENPCSVSVQMGDASSGLDIGRTLVRVGGGEPTLVNSPGGPALSWEGGSVWSLRVNLTWGRMTSLNVTAHDLAGNSASDQTSLKASRPPEVWIVVDEGVGGVLMPGKRICLTASAYDPDDEPLTFLWTMDGVRAGNGTTLEAAFSQEGPHNVSVTVTDGHFSSSDSVVLLVGEAPHGEEGSRISTLILLIAGASVLIGLSLAAAACIYALKRRRKDISEGEAEEWGIGKDEGPVRGKAEGNAGRKVYSGPERSKGKGEAKGCGICLRKVLEGHKGSRCRCGSRFHRSCAMREGVCPDCGRELMLKAD